MLICEVFGPKLLRGGGEPFLEVSLRGGEWIFDLTLRGGEEIFYPACCNPATCLLDYHCSLPKGHEAFVPEFRVILMQIFWF